MHFLFCSVTVLASTGALQMSAGFSVGWNSASEAPFLLFPVKRIRIKVWYGLLGSRKSRRNILQSNVAVWVRCKSD